MFFAKRSHFVTICWQRMGCAGIGHLELYSVRKMQRCCVREAPDAGWGRAYMSAESS